MRPALFYFIYFVFLACTFSPKEVYTTNGNNRISKKQLKQRQAILSKHLAQQIQTDFLVANTITDSFYAGDTLIKKVRFEVINTQLQEEKSRMALSALEGNLFPAFDLPTLSGDRLDQNQLKGKPTVINFWFTRCAPCIDEIPVLNALAQQYIGQYNFVAITFEEAAKVHAFLAKKPFDFIHLTNAKKFIDSIALSAYPTMVLLDREGTIQHVRGGLAYQFDQNGQLKVGDGKDLVALLAQLD